MFCRSSTKARTRLSLGVALALAAMLAVSCGGPSRWKDGKYEGKGEGVHGVVVVQVTVAKGRIAGIEILEQHEEAGVSDLAFQRIPAEIVKEQSLEVEAVTGASLSSKAILAAARDALQAASKQ